MTTPRVSILMSVHNEAHFLPACLKSIQRQSLKNWELIVIDDGSSDATPNILASTAANDPRIRVFSPGRLGLVEALNLGIRQCRANYIARMDGDDICHPDRLLKQTTYLDGHPETGFVATRIRLFPSQQITDGMKEYEAWLNSHLTHETIQRDLFVESPFANPSVMLRADILKNAGGYVDRGWPEDYDLWLRLAAAGVRFARLPETLVFWRDHPERLTRTSSSLTLEAFRNCKAHYLKQGYLARHASVTLWGAGLEGKAWRKTLENIGISIAQWVDVDPKKIGQVIHGAPVVSFDTLQANQGPMLVTIGTRNAREEVRQFALNKGLQEGRDFICVT